MKFWDKIYNALGLVDDEEIEESAAKPPVKADSGRAAEEGKPKRATVTELRPANVETVPKKTAPNYPAIPAIRVIVSDPLSFDDTKQIAENVTEKRPVIVNFAKTDAETMKRMVDFMSGITYAVGGTVQRVSGTIFLFAPGNVDVLAGDSPTEDVRGVFQWEKR